MRSIKIQIIFFTCILVLLSLGLSWYIALKTCERSLVEYSIAELSNVADEISISIQPMNRQGAVQFLTINKGLTNARILLYDANGKNLWDSQPEEAKIEYLYVKPEFQRALKEPYNVSCTYNKTLRLHTVNVFKKIDLIDGNVIVMLSKPLVQVSRISQKLNTYFFLALLLLFAFAILLGHLIVRRILHPLSELSSVAANLASGHAAKFSLVGPPEVSNLAASLKEMSENLQQTLALLSQQKDNLKQLLDSLPAGVVLADNHGKIRYLNESTISLLAMHEGSYVGKPFVGVIGIPKLIELYDRLKETPESETYFDISKPEKKYLCCKGKSIGSGFLFLITDVTEQRQLEIAMRNFIAEASHEFQTPMTVIKAAAEIMLDSPDLSKEEREELLKKIIEQQDRVSNLVDNLLYLARLEGQSIETMAQNRQKIRLDQLIEDLVNEYKSYPQGRNIKWNVNIQLKDAFTMGSPEELKRAIGNVIDNAIKYTRRKYGEKEGGIISVSLSDGGRWWRISVSDNGVGISPDIVLNIFDRFKRSSTDKIRRKGEMTGFGLGLAIAKNIIEAHNGLIEVTSAREPTTFTINLPKMKE